MLSNFIRHDPAGDWPHPPFRRERNPILVAAENGFGTVNLDEIDLETEVQPPIAAFDSYQADPEERVFNWRKTACEQALFYRDNRKKFVDKYAGQYWNALPEEIAHFWQENHSTELTADGRRRTQTALKRKKTFNA